MNTTRIFLIGFMGCGKSHTGRQLAQLLAYRFIDLDDWIEEQAGKTISAIFAREGEEGFRQRERQALQDMEGHRQIVVATGGGAPCFFDNMEWMNQKGLTIYLKAPAGLLAERLQPGREHRPLIAALSEDELSGFIARKLAEREPVYEQARIVFTQNDLFADISADLKKQITDLAED